METGKLIVITGPSGVGKGTLVRKLLARHPQLYLSISATTRTPRTGEIHGKDYYFVSRQEFEQMVQRGELLEWAEYGTNYYGTPLAQVEEILDLGKSVLLEIELVGARAIKDTFPEALRLFILPPSTAELERRLRGRGKDSPEAIERRLDCGKVEIAAAGEFDYQIINDDLDEAIAQIEAIIEEALG